MIVRIMEEDQYRLDDAESAEFERIDHALTAAATAGDQVVFDQQLTALIGYIRRHGEKVPYTEIVPSDIVVPAPDMTLDEAREVLATQPAE
jgi:hypothetical protein